MSRQHAIDIALLGAGIEPLHLAVALGALGDIDQEDLLDQPGPGVSL